VVMGMTVFFQFFAYAILYLKTKDRR